MMAGVAVYASGPQRQATPPPDSAEGRIMPSEMTERVARAIARQNQIDDGYSEASADAYAVSECALSNFRRQAIAAIEAMREPTVKMTEVGCSCFIDPWESESSVLYAAAAENWQLMIDAALK